MDRLKWVGVTALALVITASGIALAQSFEDQVADQIAAIHYEIAADFDYASDMVIGEIEAGDSDGFPMSVTGDEQYIIVAVCDADCGDVDLVLYDAEDDEAAADIEYDDYPVLDFQGEGDYWVEVVMSDCATATCLYAVQVFVLE